MTGILSRLVQRGLVSRSQSESDRRRVELRATDLGSAVLERAPSLLQDRFRNELRSLRDWEQHMLLAGLQRIASMMDASELDASPHLTIGELAPSAAPLESNATDPPTPGEA